MQRLYRSTALISGLLCVLAFGSVAAVRDLGALQWIELLTYDLLVRLRPPQPRDDPGIVVIGASETDLNRWGWPLNDATLALSLRNILAHNPRVVGVDLYRDRPVEPGGEQLNALVQNDDRIIWVSKFGDRRYPGVPPPAVLRDTDRHGFADMVQDPDGVIRRGLLFLDDGVTTSFGFALRVAMQFLAARGIHPVPGADPTHLKIGAVTFVPLESGFGGYVGIDARGYQFLLDYAAGPSPFPSIPLSAVTDGTVAPEAVRDKIVLIGVTANSVKDYFYTPFSRSESVDQTIFGVTLQGLIAHQLVRHALAGSPPFRALEHGQILAWILFWALAGGIVARYVTDAVPFIGLTAVLLVVYGGLNYAAFLQAWWLPVIPGLLAIGLSIALVRFYLSRMDRAQRALLMRLFSSYVSNQVAEEIWRKREEILHSGRPRPQRQTATALFTDIRDFTTISERLEPQALMDWLNDYMDAMAHLVVAHDGVIEKFTGDGIMALFGVPVARTAETEIREDALKAVRCALAMRAELGRLNERWSANHQPRVGIRIGIHTGPMVVGSLGSAERMQYTAIGDSVNIAARLEGLGKDVETLDPNCQILIGETTAGYVAADFERRPLGPFRLKGKENEVAVYELIGPKGACNQPRS